MEIHQRIVVDDLRVVLGNKAHAPHISRQRLDFYSTICGLKAILLVAEIGEYELVGGARLIFGRLDVRAPHPVSKILPGNSPGDDRRTQRHQ